MIDEFVLEEFGAIGNQVLLDGGQGSSVCVGDVVFKPVEDVLYYEFFASIWNQLDAKNYRVAKNLFSKNGTFVVNHYCATEYIELLDEVVPFSVKLDVSKQLHADLQKLSFTDLPKSKDPWSLSHRILWHNEPLTTTLHPELYSYCEKLISSLSTLETPFQIIHADLFGNIFYDTHHRPVVIDFSPAFVPQPYAHAILLADALAYGDEDVCLESLTTDSTEIIDYIPHAVAFRLLAQAHLAPGDLTAFEKTVSDYGKVGGALPFCFKPQMGAD